MLSSMARARSRSNDEICGCCPRVNTEKVNKIANSLAVLVGMATPFITRGKAGQPETKKAGDLAGLLISGTKLFLRCDGVFRGFGYAEFHHGLGSDLDRLTGLRIASHAGLAV